MNMNRYENSTTANKTSDQKLSKINFDDLIVLNHTPKDFHHIMDELIEVPYHVIRLTMTDKLKKSVAEFGEEVFFKY